MTVDVLENMEKVDGQMHLETSMAANAYIGGVYHK